jgi:uncharacterized membrane protein YdbT with pleckstrin-like domain
MAFPTKLLTEGEEIVLDLRPHWVALLRSLFVTLVIAVVMVGVSFGLSQTTIGGVSASLIVTAVGVVLWLMFALPPMLVWATTQFALTNERLIVRSGVFAKRSKEIPLEAVNDIAFTQTFWGRVLGAGTLTVESAGERGQESFKNVRKPEDVQKAIYRASELRKGLGVQRTTGSGSVADEIAKLAALRDQGTLTDEEFEARKRSLLDS